MTHNHKEQQREERERGREGEEEWKEEDENRKRKGEIMKHNTVKAETAYQVCRMSVSVSINTSWCWVIFSTDDNRKS